MNILKYDIVHSPFLISYKWSIEMPAGARILDVQMQDKKPVMWALVDTEREYEMRAFVVVGTGWDVPSGYEYVATWQDVNYVWHLFEDNKNG